MDLRKAFGTIDHKKEFVLKRLFYYFSDILSTADLNSADENLAFSIAHAPQRGHLESTDIPGLPITDFTQLDLAGKFIVLLERYAVMPVMHIETTS